MKLTRVLKEGMAGNDVKYLQGKLEKLKFYTYVTLTGNFGPVTKEAVKSFQSANKLLSDGIVGRKTWYQLTKDDVKVNTAKPKSKPKSKPKAKFSYKPSLVTAEGLEIYDKLLSDGEYIKSEKKKEVIYLHHTAGGCFKGDTLVQLLNGNNIRIDDMLKDKQYWIYGCDIKGNIIPCKAIGLGETKKVNELIEITLDNGSKELCTLEHKWMLRDGSYIEANELKINDSLMPLYKRLDKRGYEEIKNNMDDVWYKTHQISGKIKYGEDMYKQEQQMVIHHIDFDKLNNSPDNLKLMEKNEHILYHASLMKENWKDEKWIEKMKKVSQRNMKLLKEKQLNDVNYTTFLSNLMKKRWESGEFDYQKGMELTDDVKEKISKSIQLKWEDEECSCMTREKLSNLSKERWQDESYREKMSKMSKKLWENPEYVDKIFKFDAEFNKKLWEDPEHRKKVSKAVGERNKLYAIYRKSEHYPETTYKEWKETYNHKVIDIKIITLDNEIPVYDIYSPETSNFALASGVFVHNSRPDWVSSSWDRDDRNGKPYRIATPYVIGRRASSNGDSSFDGKVFRAFDDKYWAYHLGVKGTNGKYDKNSIGIEICNYGYCKVVDGKFINYVNREVPADEVADLGREFRGYRYWEKYTDEQIENLRKLLVYLIDKHDIEIEHGIYDWDWFDYDPEKLKGKGIRTHVQVRNDKTDMFPQQELIDMLK